MLGATKINQRMLKMSSVSSNCNVCGYSEESDRPIYYPCPECGGLMVNEYQGEVMKIEKKVENIDDVLRRLNR